jgi:flagellar protein FlaG
MQITNSQVGQNFAVPTEQVATEKKTSLDPVAVQPTQAKELSIPADRNSKIQSEVSPELIDNAVSELTQFVQTNNRQLQFSVDEASSKQVVKVTDSFSGEIIRQIPSEEILKLSERLKDLQNDVGSAVGLLFNKKV